MTMTLYSPRHCSGEVVYWAPRHTVVPMRRNNWGNLYFPMELNGRKLKTTLTTSSAASNLALDAYVTLFQNDADIKSQLLKLRGDPRQPLSLTLSLTSEGLNIVNADVHVVALKGPPKCKLLPPKQGAAGGYEDNCSDGFPLYLGLDVLKQLHMYIATGERKLYFTGATPAAFVH